MATITGSHGDGQSNENGHGESRRHAQSPDLLPHMIVRRVNPPSHPSMHCSCGVQDRTLLCGDCIADFRSERTYHCHNPQRQGSAYHLGCVYEHEGDAAFLSN